MADSLASTQAHMMTSPARLAEVFNQAIAQLRSHLQTALDQEVLSPLAALQAENAQLREQLYAAAALPSRASTCATLPAPSTEGAARSGSEISSADVNPDDKVPLLRTDNASAIEVQTLEQSDSKKKTIKRRKEKARMSRLPTVIDEEPNEAEAEAESLEIQRPGPSHHREDEEARPQSTRTRFSEISPSGEDKTGFFNAQHKRNKVIKHRKSNTGKAKSSVFWNKTGGASFTKRSSALGSFCLQVQNNMKNSVYKAPSKFGSISLADCVMLPAPTKLGRQEVEDLNESEESGSERGVSQKLKVKKSSKETSEIGCLYSRQSSTTPLIRESIMSGEITADGHTFEPFILHETWSEIARLEVGSGGGRDKSFLIATVPTDTDSDTPSELLMMQDVGRCVTLQQRCMVQPNSMKRLCWDFFGMLLIMWDILWLPFLLFDPEDTTLIIMLGWVARIFWTLDIPASFLTGYMTKEGNTVMCGPKVTRRYMKSRMFFDGLVVFADWFEVLMSTAASFLSTARVGRVMRTFRVLRVIRLARMLKLPGLLEKVSARIFSERTALLMDILKSTICIVIIAHVTACIWYKIGSMQDNNWLKEYDYANKRLSLQYAVSLHWSMSRFIGEPPVMSTTFTERCFEIVSLIAGFVMSAAFVSTITTSMTRLQIIGVEDERNFTMLRLYLRSQNVSTKLAVRITRNARFALKQQSQRVVEDDVALFQLLSEPLMIEMHFEVYGRVLRQHPAFDLFCLSTPRAMRKVCHTCIVVYHLSKGDVLFNKWERPEHGHMLMLVNGLLKYEANAFDHHHLEQGQWASEMVLWSTWQHHGNMRVETDCTVLAISSDKLQHIGQHDFDMDDEMHPAVYAKWFVGRTNEQHLRDLTDLDPGFGLPKEMEISRLVLSGAMASSAPWSSIGVGQGPAAFQKDTKGKTKDTKEPKDWKRFFSVRANSIRQTFSKKT